MLSNTYKRLIEFGDCDPAGIVWNPRYFGFTDHALTMLFTAALGKPLRDAFRDLELIGLPVVAIEAKFHRPARYGDEIAIETRVIELGRSSFRLCHEIREGGHLCVEITEVRVWTVADPEQAGRLKSAPIPEDIRVLLCRND